MAQYPELAPIALKWNQAGLSDGALAEITAYLFDVWIGDYCSYSRKTDIVETTAQGFSYLFDVAAERLIAAWGVSRGRHGGARDKARMQGHPLGNGPLYHRGHAIPHTLGGPTDINLVPQLGRINVGAFRRLEKRAVATPGSFYFTYWSYPRTRSAGTAGADQTPVAVDQGLILPGPPPTVDMASHTN